MTDTATTLEDCRRICAVPAPTFAEDARAEFVAGLLRAAGGRPRRDEVGNVLCAFGEEGSPAVVLAAHLDTVFPAEQPIEITEDPELGRLVAPGIGDNSLGVAALVALARRFAGQAPSRPLVLAATVGEEGLGDLRGAKHVVATIPCRAFIAVEGQLLDSIKTSGVGSTRYRVEYRGPGGHSWNDRGTASAVHGLVSSAEAFLRGHEDPNVSTNLGRIHGGTSINTIAAEAAIELDLRSEDPVALARVAAGARDHFASAPDGLEATVVLLSQRPGGRIGEGHHWLVEAARRARRGAGLEPALEGSASTDANAAYAREIPAITVGVSTGGNAHRPDDYIDIGPISKGLRALELLAEELTGTLAGTR